MANRSTTFGKVVRKAPESAKTRLLKVLEDTRGNVWGAARLLGLSTKQMDRYITRFNLRTPLKEIRKKSGWRSPKQREGERLDRWTKRKKLRKRKRKWVRQSTRVDSEQKPQK